MRYIDDFNTLDESDEPLVIHRHGASPGQALIVFLHGLGGKRYGTWTPKGQDATKVGLARFLYEDVEGLDVGLYAYRTLLGRLKFWKSIPLEREAEVLADRLRDQARVYQTVILAGHSMGGILAKTAIRELIGRPDAATLSAIRALMMLATPQAGSLKAPPVLWRFTEDGRVLKAHGKLVTDIQKIFNDQVVADPTPAKPNAFVIPAYVVAPAEDLWVSRFSAGLSVGSARTNSIRGTHTTGVKPETKADDSYEWLRDRIREIVQASAPAPSGLPGAQAALRNDLLRVLQSAFTADALRLHVTQIGIQLTALGAGQNTTHSALVDWAVAKNRQRALVRLMVEERGAEPAVQAFAAKHPEFAALLTSDERDLLRQCLADASIANYAALRLFAIQAIAVDLNDYTHDVPDDAADAAPHVPVLIRTADFVGKAEAVVLAALKRFAGPIVEGKLRPLLDSLRFRARGGPSASPFDVCDLQGKIFINRTTFRDALRESTDKGSPRVVAIDGPTRSGKSHSRYLIEYLERRGVCKKAFVSLEDDTPSTVTPDVLISQIVKRSGGSTKDLNLEESGAETKERWVKRLADELVGYVNGLDLPVFITLDGFDQPAVLKYTRSLVQELLKRTATEAKLRIALLGYEQDLLPQEVSGRIVAEPIGAFSTNDIRRFFLQYAHDQGKGVPAQSVLNVLVQQVQAAVPQAQPDPERNKEVAEAVEVWAAGLKELE
jgi:hypothetical protein